MIRHSLPSSVLADAFPFDLEAFLAGDPHVLQTLLDTLSGELHRYLLYLGLSYEDARDIFASVSAKLFHRRARMQSYGHIRRSFFIMARNEAIDCLRLQSKWRKSEKAIQYLHDRAENFMDRDLAAQLDQWRDLLLQNIRQEIARLPPQRQKVLHLYYTQDLSTAEIAARLNLNSQTVLNHKSRGLAALKNAIRRSGLTWYW
jgi:RNA polymerase sigma-70 factor (ECF subfamily)